jgi:hypothetical protein
MVSGEYDRNVMPDLNYDEIMNMLFITRFGSQRKKTSQTITGIARASRLIVGTAF